MLGRLEPRHVAEVDGVGIDGERARDDVSALEEHETDRDADSDADERGGGDR